ncbi:ABC transporter substrate-binding protein [Vallitalea maricola]|uniref:Extracellular solute-binding protein n=1 Tax=Vallitalea maricola TaxID=3074433 RepID=A0ACB5UJ00_9FIRM|nr:extracellular solute-binding protein [Vallitalea sp. AN17-2]
MKKSLSVILAITICLSIVLAGCQNKQGEKGTKPTDGTTEEVVTLKLMGWDNESQQKVYLEPFRKDNPNIKIEYQFVDNKQFDNVLNAQLAANEGPDIIIAGAQVKNLAAAGYLTDLTNEPIANKYMETGLSAFSFDGKYYGIPKLSWFEGVFYNKKIFAENDIEIPKTYDEWLQIHETLKEVGIKPQTMGAKSWEPMMKQSMGLLLNEFYATDAGKNFDEDFDSGKKTVEGNWNDALDKWGIMVERGYITKEMLGLDYDQALEEFALEKAAMWDSGPWSDVALKEKNPDLDYGMFPFPGSKEGTGWLVGGPGGAFCINKNTKHKEAAIKFLEYISTPEIQIAWAKEQSGSSFLKGVEVELGPVYEDCAKAFKAGNVYCPWNNWFGAQSIIMEMGKAEQDFIAGQKNIEQVVKAIDKKAEEIKSNRE